MSNKSVLLEPAAEIPIVYECDLCVIGGSCTGLFAAIRAARLGLKVAIVEQANCFGGVATISMVCVWLSFMDTAFSCNIVGGLSQETIDRLKKVNAVTESPNDWSVGFRFNSNELKIELDEMAKAAGLKVYFHTMFVKPHVENGQIAGAIIENKSGRGAIRARFFIDASGDADLAYRAGVPTYEEEHRNPSTTGVHFANWSSLGNVDFPGLNAHIRAHAAKEGLPNGFAWEARIPNSDVHMLAATRILNNNPTLADDFTAGEIEGRRQVRALSRIFKRAVPTSNLEIVALAQRMGIRETRKVHSRHRVTSEEVLYGVRYEDAIANGSYRVDVHHQDKPGVTFKYLDGSQTYIVPGEPFHQSRWRSETAENPTFYQIPYRSLVPQGPYGNLLVAGRMLDSDIEAFGALRVMVNMNQTGEAAGVAAYLALKNNYSAGDVNPETLRKTLADGGSIII